MTLYLRASVYAGVVGAVPPILFVVAMNLGLNPVSGLEFLAVLFAMLCPPWEVFWAGIGEPNNVPLWARLSAIVIVSNALLYAPLGLAYVRFSSLRPFTRWAAVLGVAIAMLGFGHLFFLSLT